MTRNRPLLFGAFFALPLTLSTNSSAASGDYEREDDLTMEVVSCEEAFARLEECCPGFRAPDNGCRDYRYRRTSTCSGTVSEGGTDPTFTRAESQCIRDKSCEGLAADGFCTAWPEHTPVCR